MTIGAASSTLEPDSPNRRKVLGGLIALSAIGALPVLVGFATNSRKLTPPASAIPVSYFGMHIHRAGRTQPWLTHGVTLTPWPSTKFGSWRLWDAYVSWPYLEPQRGKWDFTLLDRYVAIADLTGVNILLPLGLTPPWASARPLERSSYGPGNAAEPRSMDDWRNYVCAVAERYKGRIQLYEVWNEINLKGFYTGSLETMIELACIAHQEIKQIDPEAKLVSPSVTGEGRNPEWLDRYLALGGGQYADVIGYHFYVPTRSPESMLPLIEEVRSIMRERGVAHKPLWNTESGWWIENLLPSTRLGAAGADWRRLDQRMAAAYVSRALVLGWAAGVSRFYWYAWDNHDMGLYDGMARRQKPAAEAYARTTAWMAGARMRACTAVSGVWVCELDDAQGKRARIVWRESGEPASWTLPSGWNATTLETLDGQTGPLAGDLLLGQQPVLVS